jgi:hypothetical protein
MITYKDELTPSETIAWLGDNWADYYGYNIKKIDTVAFPVDYAEWNRRFYEVIWRTQINEYLRFRLEWRF